MGTATLIVRHQVEDYGTWRTVYDSLEGLRQQHGCTGKEVMVGQDDKNDVYVIHRFPTFQAAQGFAASDELRAGMGKAGVIGRPRIEIAVEA